MKLFTLCLALMLCAKSHGAVADDIAREFLAGVAAQGVAPVLTNTTLVPALNARMLVTTNAGFGAVAGGLVHFDTGNYTNLNALSTLSNMAEVIIPPLTLTNLGDRLRGFAE